LDGLTQQLSAIKQVIADAGPYVVLVILAFFYMRYQRQREHEQANVAIVQAETQNAMSANQATLIQLTEKSTTEFRTQSEKNNALIQQFLDLSTEMKQVMAASNAAAQRQDAALTTFGERFASEITGMKTAVNAAGERMTARAEATDAQLRSIQAGVEYTGKVATDTKAVIDTLPVDTTKVVLEIGDRAMNDHAHIQRTVDAIAAKLDELPKYVADAIAPLIADLRKEIKAITLTAPVREVAIGALPLNERDIRAAAELRAELGRAEAGA